MDKVLNETETTWTIIETINGRSTPIEVTRFDLQQRAYEIAIKRLPKALSNYPNAHPSDLESFLIDRAMKLVDTFINNVDNKGSFDNYCGSLLVRKLPEFGRKTCIEQITDIRDDAVIDDTGTTVSFMDTIPDTKVIDEGRIIKTMAMEAYLNSLSERHKSILLSKAEGLSSTEIGSALGISRQAVNKTLTTITKQAHSKGSHYIH